MHLRSCLLANCTYTSKKKNYFLTTNSSFFWAGRAFFCAIAKVGSKPEPLSSTERLSEEYKKNGTTRVVEHPKMFSRSALNRLLQMAPRGLLLSLVRSIQWHRSLWSTYHSCQSSNKKMLPLRLLACLGFPQLFFILQQLCGYLGLIEGWSEGSPKTQLIQPFLVQTPQTSSSKTSGLYKQYLHKQDGL